MMWLKACPRCRGDLYEGRDHFGAYIECAQCGRTLNQTEERAFRQLAARRVRGGPAAAKARARGR